MKIESSNTLEGGVPNGKCCNLIWYIKVVKIKKG